MFNALLQLLMYTRIKTWIFRVISAVFATVASIVIIFSMGMGSNASAQIIVPHAVKIDSDIKGLNTCKERPPLAQFFAFQAKQKTADTSSCHSFILTPVSDVPTFEKDEKLFKLANEEKEATIETLKELVNIESPTDYEKGMEEIYNRLKQDKSNFMGIEPEKRTNENDRLIGIVATIPGENSKGKKLLLLAHIDTVFKRNLGEQKGSFQPDNPTNPTKANGYGIADDKSGVTLILHSLKLLQKLNFKDFQTIQVLLNTDEETGSKRSNELIKELAAASDVVFSYEPTQFNPYEEPPKTELMALTLSGATNVKATVTGKPAHSGSNPDDGINALVEASDFVMRTRDLDQGDGKLRFSWTQSQLDGTANIIPAKVILSANVRYPNEKVYNDMKNELEKRAENRCLEGAEIELEVPETSDSSSGRPPFNVEEENCRLIKNAIGIYQSVDHDIQLIPATGGGTDAGYASQENDSVIEGLGLPGGGSHTQDEWVDLNAIPRRLYLSVRLIIKEATGK